MSKIQNYWFNMTNNKSSCHPINILLLLISYLYGFILFFRRSLYGIGLLKIRKFPVKVISIGNITLGGTGKTPMVIKTVESMDKNKKIGILTRGYKRKSKRPIIIEPNRVDEFDINDIGDEPYMIAKRLPDVYIGVGKDRYKIGTEMIKKFNLDCLILDDGYHKLDIKRDKNMLLLDASNPFGNGKLFPRGILREFKKEIKRSNFVVITKSNCVSDATVDSLKKKLEDNYKKNVLLTDYVPVNLFNLKDDTEHSLDIIKGKDVTILTAIGNPSSFKKTVTDIGAVIKKDFNFPDHHWYADSDIKEIIKQCPTDVIVTTEKDMCKLVQFKNNFQDKLIYVLSMDIIFQPVAN